MHPNEVDLVNFAEYSKWKTEAHSRDTRLTPPLDQHGECVRGFIPVLKAQRERQLRAL